MKLILYPEERPCLVLYHCQDIVLLYYDELFLVQLHFGSGILGVDHVVVKDANVARAATTTARYNPASSLTHPGEPYGSPGLFYSLAH